MQFLFVMPDVCNAPPCYNCKTNILVVGRVLCTRSKELGNTF